MYNRVLGAEMSRLPFNKFISTHTNVHCVGLVFPDFRSSLTDAQTGKILPTPNNLVSVYLRPLTNGWTLKSMKVKYQLVMLEDAADVQRFSQFPRVRASSLNPACTSSTAFQIDMQTHISIAKQLGLF